MKYVSVIFKSNSENILAFEYEEGQDTEFDWNLQKKAIKTVTAITIIAQF